MTRSSNDTACRHSPPCPTLHLYLWHGHFIAAPSVNMALELVEVESLIETSEVFDPCCVPTDETILVHVDEDGCQCNEDDTTDEIELTPAQWICRQREGNVTEFIVGKEF